MLFSGILRIAAGPTSARPNLVAFLGAPDSLRSQIEYPRQDERDWKTQHQREHNKADRPIGNFEERKNLRRDLNDQPARDGVGDGNAIDLAAFQFGKK